MTLGLALLSTLRMASSIWAAPAYMLVLGLGLGMVMQVLVLAVQNTVDYRDLGVATAGTTLFRSTGGSVGVSLFGAIFAAGLASRLATLLPIGAPVGNVSDAASIHALPVAEQRLYLQAFTEALHPVFLSAAAIAAVGFVLTWFLKEVPLRGGRAETIGESFALPHDATSLEELELIVSQFSHGERRWDIYRRIAERADVQVSPQEMWLLIQICRSSDPVSLVQLGKRKAVPRETLEDVAGRLVADGLAVRDQEERLLPSRSGSQAFDSIVVGYRHRLAEVLERWSPEEHAEVRTMLDRFARDLVAELPVAPARRRTSPANARRDE
jgi:hypothetical protein